MKRGEIWTVSGGAGYAGKPRPALIVQDDLYAVTQSVTICGFTRDVGESPITRPLIESSAENGLAEASSLMVDKLMTVPRSGLGQRIGALELADLERVDRALLIFLGLAD